MAKPYFYRWTDETAAAVEAARVRSGVKTTKEALDALVSAGLAAEARARDPTPVKWVDPAEMAKRYPPEPSSKAAKPTGISEDVSAAMGATLSVAWAGDIKRQAKPKTQKGKGK